MDYQTTESPLKDSTSIELIRQEGVGILKQIITPEHITTIKNEIKNIREYVMQKIANMDRPLRTYSDIAERQLNRLDYRCGFTANIFNEVAKPIVETIQQISPNVNFRYYWGAIPSLAGSGPTDLHRDIYPILNTSKGNDLDSFEVLLPPYYYTALIPLVEITNENGPTEFIKKSHLIKKVNEDNPELYAPLTQPGDVVVFDGRTLHRGRANNSNDERLIAYITFVAHWYHDQTFKVNDYLFPEWAIKGQ